MDAQSFYSTKQSLLVKEEPQNMWTVQTPDILVSSAGGCEKSVLISRLALPDPTDDQFHVQVWFNEMKATKIYEILVQ